ncbi:MAG: hypothetical protein J0H89_15100, partial [Rhizobiales bacterium]|nr:hypothetical protein [Hyphomicrobiales bacterium]
KSFAAEAAKLLTTSRGRPIGRFTTMSFIMIFAPFPANDFKHGKKMERCFDLAQLEPEEESRLES